MASVYKKIFLLLCVAALSVPAFCAQQSSAAYGYSIDFPEGFYLQAQNDDGSAYQFASTVAPVSAILRVYPDQRFGSALDALNQTLDAVGADGESEEFEWRGFTAAVASFEGTFFGIHSLGLGIASPLPYQKGTLVLFAWAEDDDFYGYQSYVQSLLDAVCIDRGSFFEPGPLTTYAYPPEPEQVAVSLDIGGRAIRTTLNAVDAEASQYLIEREYDVLCMYQTSRLWKEAWQRYYRMIFRDSSGRLRTAAFDICNALLPVSTDDTDLAQKLLTWVQGFDYERDTTTSDFASLPSILLGGGSDCDSRSMLLAVLLNQMNVDAILFVSAEFSHAIAGIVSTHPGHGYTVSGKEYLLGETTAAGLTWGKIAADQDRQSAWIPVEPPLAFGN